MVRQAQLAYEGRQYEAAAKAFAAAIAQGAYEAAVAYNAACSHALAGDKEQAFRYLRLAIERGFSHPEHMLADADLGPLHGDARWEAAIEQARRDQRRKELRWNTPALNTAFQEDLSEDEKIAGLSKLWAEVRYNFAWFERVPDLDWDALYLGYLPRVRATKSTAGYYVVLQELVARLEDGHTQVFAPPQLRARRARPGLSTRWVEGRVLVVGVQDEQAAREGVTVGLQISEVNGVPVRQYAARHVAPLQSASTRQDLDSRTYERELLEGPVGEEVRVTFESATGERFERALRRPPASELWATGTAFEYRLLPGNVAYVALNSFADRQAADGFERHFKELSRTDALVVDIRENGGGNSGEGYRVLAMLAERPFKSSRWRTREYRPAERAWGETERSFGEEAEQLPPDNARRYGRPVIVLTSPRTCSAAEDFAMAFDVMGRGLLLGEPTCGSTGQPLHFTLPGGGTARVCVKQDMYPDGRQFVGVGIQPHRRVAPTVVDVRSGRDTVLEAALEELRRTRNLP